jgi:queuine tRNA-ribosyltransferase
MKPERHEIVRTRAGLLAMRSREASEIMHPGVGPLAEAEALYVRQSRLAERLASGNLVLFDVGLGAGSNALAARAAAERAPAGHLELVSFERDLEALQLALTEPAAFGLEGEPGEAARALLAQGRHDSPRTTWRLRHGELLAALQDEATADIVFWDPYSPRANPELWTIAAFSTLRRHAGPSCTLFTYSSSTATRVALLLAGWAVGAGDPVGGRGDTTAAAVNPGDLARPLPRSWLNRLGHPNAPLPADAPEDVIARTHAAPQFR